jgi:hypothetical protein
LYFCIRNATKAQHDLLWPLTECTKTLSPASPAAEMKLEIILTFSLPLSNKIYFNSSKSSKIKKSYLGVGFQPQKCQVFDPYAFPNVGHFPAGAVHNVSNFVVHQKLQVLLSKN